MKKLGAALVLIAFTIGAQVVIAADNPPPKKPYRRGGQSLTINGTAAHDAKSSGTSVTTSYEYNNEASASSSSSSSSAPQPLEDQKIKTKSNIKND